MGLESLLTQMPNAFKSPMQGWQEGGKQAIEDRQALANLDTTNLSNDRYKQMTQLEVEGKTNSNEALRLANLQGEANERAGIPDAQAKFSAAELKAKLESLPIQQQEALRKHTQAGIELVPELILSYMSTSNNPSLKGTLAELSQFMTPLMESDPNTAKAFQSASQRALQYFGDNKQKFTQTLQQQLANSATGKVHRDPASILKLILQQMQDASAYSRTALSVSAASGDKNPTNGMLIQDSAQVLSYPEKYTDQQYDQAYRLYTGLTRSFEQNKETTIAGRTIGGESKGSDIPRTRQEALAAKNNTPKKSTDSDVTVIPVPQKYR